MLKTFIESVYLNTDVVGSLSFVRRYTPILSCDSKTVVSIFTLEIGGWEYPCHPPPN